MGKSVYLVAFLATLAIMLIIVFSVKSFEDASLESVNNDLKSLQLEQEIDNAYFYFLLDDKNAYCSFLHTQIDSDIQKLSLLENEINAKKENFFSEQYISAKRFFLVTNLSLYQKVHYSTRECNLDLKPVLYFYDESNSCDVDCGVLVNQLELLKKDCNNVRVFAFPYDAPQYDFLKVFEKLYDVNKPATIVIDNNKIESIQSLNYLKEKVSCE